MGRIPPAEGASLGRSWASGKSLPPALSQPAGRSKIWLKKYGKSEGHVELKADCGYYVLRPHFPKKAELKSPQIGWLAGPIAYPEWRLDPPWT